MVLGVTSARDFPNVEFVACWMRMRSEVPWYASPVQPVVAPTVQSRRFFRPPLTAKARTFTTPVLPASSWLIVIVTAWMTFSLPTIVKVESLCTLFRLQSVAASLKLAAVQRRVAPPGGAREGSVGIEVEAGSLPTSRMMTLVPLSTVTDVCMSVLLVCSCVFTRSAPVIDLYVMVRGMDRTALFPRSRTTVTVTRFTKMAVTALVPLSSTLHTPTPMQVCSVLPQPLKR
mmetsp:Transcript_42249/g.106583  ORF Transcript_42249/g.106583 Transcript_42249/m.106583 type:complete len:230 (+) Transcript_42249:2424-3113(+)